MDRPSTLGGFEQRTDSGPGGRRRAWRRSVFSLAVGVLLCGALVQLLLPGIGHWLAVWADQAGVGYLPLALSNEEPVVPAQATATMPRPTSTNTLPPPLPSPTLAAGQPTPFWPPPTGPDALGELLTANGLRRADLGYRPRGDWTRYPLLERTPYLLPLFAPLFSEPLRSYDLARTLGTAADRFLRPDTVNTAYVFRAVYYLGFDRKVGNFREYEANTVMEPAANDPLREAIRDIYQYAREDLVHYTFGTALPGEAEAIMDRDLPEVPLPLQQVVARALLNQLEAIKWRDRGLRHVDPSIARKLFPIRDLGDTQGDGTIYYPQIDDVASQLDAASFYYGGLLGFQTAQQARLALGTLADPDRCPPRMVDIPTPFGRVVIGTCGADTYTDYDILLSVEPGGADTHRDNAGGTAALEIPVAIAVDVSGNDIYDCWTAKSGVCQGAGVLGHGVLMDGSGDDTYYVAHHGQGASLLGLGALLDVEGNDRYEARWVAQGASFFGVANLLDAAGNDSYRLLWDGQGYGGVGGGVGVLADRSGDDSYFAEPDTRQTPDFPYRNYGGNGQPNANISFAQGASAGRRGDISDGHSWPGGLGALVDVEGDDRYQAGAFAQGYGYWYGVGVMYDGAGNDRYRSVYYSLASGAHYSVSAIVDEAGDDSYMQEQTIPQSTAGAGVAFAWDFVNALIFDRYGNDWYESRVNCLGRATQKGNAFLIDGAGDDTYVAGPGGSCVGSADYNDYYVFDPYRTYVRGFESSHFGLLLDLGGQDRYLEKDWLTMQLRPHPWAAEGKAWNNPEPDVLTARGGTNREEFIWGLGLDRADGLVPEFNRIPPVYVPTPRPTAGILEQAPAPGDLVFPDREPLVPVAPKKSGSE